MKTKLLYFILLIGLSTFGQNFKAVAYMPSYRMTNLGNLNYNLITHVMASFVNPDTSGSMSFPADIDDFVNTVHNKGAKAIISIGGGGDYSWGNKVSIYENLIKSPQSRTDFIHKIMDYLRSHKLDGLDNDIEGNALALSNFNVFSQELGDSLHTEGLEYSAAIGVGSSWGLNLWDKKTLDKLDFIMTMSYGGVGSWNWSTKPDDHTFKKMKDDMEYLTVTNKIAKEKVLGGIPFYSVEFPSSAQSSYGSYMKTICSIYNDPQFANQDPLHSDTLYTTGGNPVYINSIETIHKKMDYCNDFGGGIMVWEAGQDCYDGSINLLDSMYTYKLAKSLSTNKVNSLKVSLFPNPTVDQLNIKTDLNGSFEFTIYNKLSQVVKKGNSTSINTSNFKSGIYYISINYEGHGSTTMKFCVK